MDRKEIIALFLKKGALLRKEELEQLAALGDAEIVEIIAAADSRAELARRTAAPKFDIVKSLASKPRDISAEFQNRFFNSRYEQMKAIVSQRIVRDIVSLNRMPGRGEVFIAGIVRNIRAGEKTIIELEDPTGSVAVTFGEKPNVGLDEFLTVRAAVAGRAVFGKEILYPDIPIRPATKGSGRGCFISDLHLEEAPPADARRLFSALAVEGVDWLFVAGDTGNIALFEEMVGSTPTFLIPGEADTADGYPQLPLATKRSTIVPLSNPAVVRVGGLNVLLCHSFDVGMLRRRHLGPSAEILETDFLALDCVPDIVGCGHDHKPLVSNYKATTVVNAGSLLTNAAPVIIDFATREWKQLKI